MHANVLFLLKTWELDTCRLPHISGYVRNSLWWPSTKLRGQGGVAVLYKEELKNMVNVCKLDKHMRYIWIKLCRSTQAIFIARCYIPDQGFPFYDTHNVEKNDPFTDLFEGIVAYTQEGMVMIIRDLNARIANAQVQLVYYSLHPADKEGDLALDLLWHRCSYDQTTNA